MTSDLNQQAVPERKPAARRRSYRIRDRRFLQLKRKSRNLSQAALASSVGVSRSAVTHWESGFNPCIEPIYAERIAAVLDEPMETLFAKD